MLHGNPSECICNGTKQDDNCKDRAKVPDHKTEDMFSAERLSVLSYFFLQFVDSDDSGYKQTGCHGRYWHHDGVCQEIKEIQELHSDDGDTGKWTISKTGKGSENNHDQPHDDGRFFFGPSAAHLQK